MKEYNKEIVYNCYCTQINMGYWIYILRCSDGTLYTGSTTDPQRRLAVHQSGKGAKYTRSRLPVEMVYREELLDKSAALQREAAIKQLSRAKKLLLIQSSQKENIAADNPQTALPHSGTHQVKLV